MVSREEALIVCKFLEQARELGNDIYVNVLHRYQNEYPAFMFCDGYYKDWDSYKKLMIALYGEDFFGADISLDEVDYL